MARRIALPHPARRRSVTATLLLAGALASTGCLVPKKQYDQAIADATKAKAAADAKQKDDAGRIADLQQQLAAMEATVQDREGKLNDLSTSTHNLQAQLDEETAINQQLRGELQRLGKDVDKILAERGTLSKALDDAKARLEELRKAQADAEARVALFKDLEGRFKPLIDAGQLRVETRRGQMTMVVSGDLLFDSGHAEVRSAGRGVLMEIARALETTSPPMAGRRFLVTDHVDDEPMKGKHWRSAWELTAARAAQVVEYLVSLHVPAAVLTAAGAGSADPLVPNDSAADRMKNRRLELALLPGPEDTVPVQSQPAAPPPAASR